MRLDMIHSAINRKTHRVFMLAPHRIIGRNRIIMCLMFILCAIPSILFAFQTDSTNINISLSISIDNTETPLNIPVEMTVIMSWEGGPDRYSIGTFENPVLTNLLITGSESKSRTEVRNGVVFTVKEYTYSIQPAELGMGYIESIIIEYTDNMAGIKDHLITQRMSVKGLVPVFERGYSLIWAGLGLLALSGFLVGLVLVMRRKAIVKKLGEIQPDLIKDSEIKKIKSIQSDSRLSFKQKTGEIFVEFKNYLVMKFRIPEDSKSDKQVINVLEES
ncbi:hypothetical protein IIB79_06795, partial [candidate division KSB1 bacterium]|nr:hypothetical protein [candidate division KSB1 bacterium]